MQARYISARGDIVSGIYNVRAESVQVCTEGESNKGTRKDERTGESPTPGRIRDLPLAGQGRASSSSCNGRGVRHYRPACPEPLGDLRIDSRIRRKVEAVEALLAV